MSARLFSYCVLSLIGKEAVLPSTRVCLGSRVVPRIFPSAIGSSVNCESLRGASNIPKSARSPLRREHQEFAHPEKASKSLRRVPRSALFELVKTMSGSEEAYKSFKGNDIPHSFGFFPYSPDKIPIEALPFPDTVQIQPYMDIYRKSENERKTFLSVKAMLEAYDDGDTTFLWTDASVDPKSGLSAGAAILQFPDGSIVQTGRFLRRGLSVEDAEKAAIVLGLSLFEKSKNIVEGGRLLVLSDSQWSLAALRAWDGSPSIQSLKRGILRMLSYFDSVVLQWVPAHVGVEMNEQVDRLAKIYLRRLISRSRSRSREAAKRTLSPPPPFSSPSFPVGMTQSDALLSSISDMISNEINEALLDEIYKSIHGAEE